MKLLPEEIRKAWENREGAAVFGTVDSNGIPNMVYVSCVGLYEDNCFVIADNYFDKTRKNIQSGSKGVLLFLTKDRKSYQIKGALNYEKQGKRFDYMKSINPTRHPGYAAAILNPEEEYSGSQKII